MSAWGYGGAGHLIRFISFESLYEPVHYRSVEDFVEIWGLLRRAFCVPYRTRPGPAKLMAMVAHKRPHWVPPSEKLVADFDRVVRPRQLPSTYG